MVYYIDLSPLTIYANAPQAETSSFVTSSFWIQLGYFSIAGILLLKFIFQLTTLVQLRFGAHKATSPIDQETIFISPHESFSFFHWIFIKQEDLHNAPIYFHEKQHAKYWHSLDITVLKLLQTILWFNPFLFLFEKELRLQHEYAVDNLVLNKGTKKKDYQQLLLNQVFNTEFNLITNNFNQSFLKNRFIMMTKQEPKKVSTLLLMALFGLIIIAPLAISCSMEPETISNETEITEPQKLVVIDEASPVDPEEDAPIEEKTFLVVDEMPEFIGGEKAMYNYIAKNISYPVKAKEAGVTGRVFVSFIIEKDGSISKVEVMRGIGSGCDKEAVKVISSMPKWKPGKQRGKEVRVQYRMPINFLLQ